jgi:hypothetical protein
MAYKQNGITIVDDEGNWTDRSFDSVPDIAATETKITASDGSLNDEYGWSVAVGCGKIVVGARDYDNGGGSNETGCVYVYDLDGTNEFKITASDGAAGDWFGYSVAVGEGKIVVGAVFDDDNGNNSGSAYIYNLDGTGEIKITASDAAADERFGNSVAVGNGKIVVGASTSSDPIFYSGSAYIYDLDGTNEIKITASDKDTINYFGTSVAVGYGRIVVGAYGYNSRAGKIYIFDLNGRELASITASDGAQFEYFGYSVAVGCGRIVVGAWNDDDKGGAYIYDLDGTNETKITPSDGSLNDEYGNSVAVGNGKIVVGAHGAGLGGSVYVYDLDGTNETKITASDAASTDLFGYSVAVGSGKIVVGAYQDDDNGGSSGSAYIYNLPETTDIYWENIIEGFRW